MGVVAEIARFLQGASPSLSLAEGTNLFTNELPETPVNVPVVAVEKPPVDDGDIRTFGPVGTAPTVTQPRFIVVVRAPVRSDAMRLARQIRFALDDKVNGAITNPDFNASYPDGSTSTTFYHSVRALGDPYERPAYKPQTFEVAVTYSAMKARS